MKPVRSIAFVSLFVLTLLSGATPAAAQIFTVAGSGTAGFSGDGGSALSAMLNQPYAVAADAAGNFYIADYDNNRVRRVSTGGVITTIAGNGTRGYSGDGGPATAAAFNEIIGLAVDGAGNVFIADAANRRIRKVGLDGNVTTIAGTGVQGGGGDGGPATSAQLNRPSGIALDANGNMYIADSSNHRVRRINADGTIFTVAGSGTAGFSGDGGQANTASLNFPLGMAVDNLGNLYIADAENHRIRMVTPGGIISTIAGTGSTTFNGDGAAATSSTLNFPSDIWVDGSGRLFIADRSHNRVRMVANSVMTTVAGTGSESFSGDGGPGTSAAVNFPNRIAITTNGNLLIADTRNHRVRRLAGVASGVVIPPPFGGATPILPANSAVNAGSFRANEAVAQGGIISIFGTSLASGTASATATPLPTTLLDTTVTVNGTPIPLFFVSPGQINAQLPFGVQPGTVQLQISRGSNNSATQTLSVSAASPGIFTMNQQGSGQGAILNTAGQLVDATNRATTGQSISVFLTGLGATSPAVASGQRAPSAEPFARTLTTPSVTIGGIPATVTFAGLAPGFVGLYQVNVTIPAGAGSGTAVPLVITHQGGISNTVTLALQ